MTTTPARLRPDQALEAAGYIRVSLERQAEGYSPDVQRDAIKRLAAEQGYLLLPENMFEDHERGSKVSRAGYQAIIEKVRQGTIHAVIVFMFDRWGRDGAEWLTRAREFERLHVPIISVQEGRDEGGLMRFIRAGMAEEESRKIARRVVPARERAARRGQFMGQTPYGYRRYYPPQEGMLRYNPGRLVIDEATAWVMREMYERYASGGESYRTLALWLNADPRVGPAPKGGRQWTAECVRHMLHNPVYKGGNRFNHVARGLYERGAPDSEFVVEDAHPAIVSVAVWDDVQRRSRAACNHPTYNRTSLREGNPMALASGLFKCAGCGAPMAVHTTNGRQTYRCTLRYEGNGCHEREISATIANAALLAEVRRLRGSPWTPQKQQRLLAAGGADDSARLASIAQALAAEREGLKRHTRLMSAMADDPTAEQIAAFRAVSAEYSTRIQALEAQLRASEQQAKRLPTLQTLHAQLTQTEIPGLIDTLLMGGRTAALRDLVLAIVAEARISERRPAYNPVWARVAVSWTPDVATFLDAGLLALDDQQEAPYVPTSRERDAARRRRYRAERKAAKLAGSVPS